MDAGTKWFCFVDQGWNFLSHLHCDPRPVCHVLADCFHSGGHRGHLYLDGPNHPEVVMYALQRLCGGVPEAADAVFFGPGTGETPETAALRKLKKGSDGERWIVVRRDGHTAVFRISDATSIKSSGLYVNHDVETLRGDGPLVACLKGHDRLHLCRNEVCNEEGQHFKEYAIVKQFNAEKFQLAAAMQGAQEAGAVFVQWFGRGASKAAKRVRTICI